MTAFPPLTHVALTVRDLSVSVPWYEALLDAEAVLDEDTDPKMHHTVYLLGNGTLLGLHQHQTPAPTGQFSEYRVGLDHIAFGCADRSELEKWARRLDELGVDARWHQGCGVRLGRELPRPRWHRTRVLRSARRLIRNAVAAGRVVTRDRVATRRYCRRDGSAETVTPSPEAGGRRARS